MLKVDLKRIYTVNFTLKTLDHEDSEGSVTLSSLAKSHLGFNWCKEI